MHKTVTITLGGVLFTLEEDAYRSLDAYLSAIRAHFLRYPDPDEIVSDIESRIAEEFGAALSVRKKVITQKDVDALITRMGTVEDFAEFEGEQAGEEPRTEEEKKKKEDAGGWRMPQGRLYRDSEDQILGGVCAGIANYLKIDPTIMRLLFILLVFFNGFGILLYVILWVILPEARTPTEKVEMARERVTISAIQQRIKQTVGSEKTRGTVRNMLAVPVLIVRRALEVLGNLLRVLFPVLARIIGFLIVLGSALAIAGLTTLFVLLIVSPGNVLIDLPLHEILDGFTYRTLLFSSYALLFLPIVVVLMLGATFLNLKNAFSIRSFLVLVALWSGAIVVAGVTGFSAVPSIKVAFDRLAEERDRTVTKTFEVADFDRVRIDGPHRFTLVQSDDPSVTLEAHAQRMPRMDIAVEEGTLMLRRGPYQEHCLFFCSRPSVTMTVHAPTLSGIEAGGISHTDIASYTGETLAFLIHDNASVNADVTVQDLTVEASGIGRLTLSGSADTTTMTVGDVASVDGRAFRVSTATVTTRDLGNVLLNVLERLTGSASDQSEIRFLQPPAELSVETNDLATVGAEGE